MFHKEKFSNYSNTKNGGGCQRRKGRGRSSDSLSCTSALSTSSWLCHPYHEFLTCSFHVFMPLLFVFLTIVLIIELQKLHITCLPFLTYIISFVLLSHCLSVYNFRIQQYFLFYHFWKFTFTKNRKSLWSNKKKYTKKRKSRLKYWLI